MTSLSARTVAAIVALRVRHEDTVDAFRRRRAQEVRDGHRRFVAQRATLLEEDLEKVVLQKDFLNVVGGVDSQSNGLAEVQVTRDADGGMRFFAEVDVHLVCKNTSGGTLTKGTPVYVTGSVGATTTVEVAASDAANVAKMPAIGLLEQTLVSNEFGRVVAVGVLSGLNTTGYSINQTVFVASGGGLTGTRPTAPTELVQNIGRVLRVGTHCCCARCGTGRTHSARSRRGCAGGAGGRRPRWRRLDDEFTGGPVVDLDLRRTTRARPGRPIQRHPA
jgi:hypothetical protein